MLCPTARSLLAATRCPPTNHEMQGEGCLGDDKAAQEGAREPVLAAAQRKRPEQRQDAENRGIRATPAAGEHVMKLKEAEAERARPATDAAKAASKQKTSAHPLVLAFINSCSS